MDGRQKPNPQSEHENEQNDDEIIDLTQVTEGEDNEDIIDLDDMLVQPEPATDEAIPLVNAISPDGATAQSEDTDDDIIDLEELASPSEPDNYGSGTDEDDGIIDLMDVATTLESDIIEPESDILLPQPEEETLIVAEDVVESASTDDTEDVIDLMDAIKPEIEETEEFAELESRADAMLVEPTDLMAQQAEGLLDIEPPEETDAPDRIEAIAEESHIVEPGYTDQPDAAIPFTPVAPPETPATQPTFLTDAQVEAALERVIEKIYGEKIETMMVQTIEKTVKQEIEKIKHALTEDSKGMDG